MRASRAKLLLIVNGQLKMGKGKICAQVGHGVIGAYRQIKESARFHQESRLRLQRWENIGEAKIAVKAKNLQEMLDIKSKLEKLGTRINTFLVQDTQNNNIETRSKTVLAVGPAFAD